MNQIGIVAYTAERKRGLVVIHKAYAGREETLATKDWEELVNFLTEDKGVAIHICYSLDYFTEDIFSLLPQRIKKELAKKTRVFYGDTKIFSTDRMLGLTVTRQLNGNFYRKAENNFYGISRWLPDSKPLATCKEIEQLGNEIITGLEKLNIYTNKLTSPVGVFTNSLDWESLPTIYNFNLDYLEVMNWAKEVAGYEWREKFKHSGYAFTYDLTSAYGSIMATLPDTRHGTVSRKRGNHQWGICKATVSPSSQSGVLPIDKDARYFTTEEIDWVEKHTGGHFELSDGYYFNFNGGQPYQPIIDNLFAARQNGDIMTANLAKRIVNGLSGKLDQENFDGSMGELYNPILALMVRSRSRLKVADFIYNNDLQDSLIEVLVDSVTTTKKLDLPIASKPGEWRLVE